MQITEIRCTACNAPVPPEAVRMALARCPFCGVTLHVRGTGRGPLLAAADLSQTPPPGFWVSPKHGDPRPPELMAHLGAAPDYFAYVLKTNAVFDDFEAVVRLRLHWGDLRHSRAGLLFRHRDDRTFGMAWISTARTFFLGYVKDGRGAALVPWTPHDAILGQPGDLNELALRCFGDRLELRLNGALAASVRDASLTHGAITVAGRSDEQPMAFSIAAFEVYGIAAEEQPPVPELAAPRVGDLYDLVLTRIDPNKKIQTIKVLRDATKLGLAETKRMTEELPCRVLEGVPKQRADLLREALAQVGAQATLA